MTKTNLAAAIAFALISVSASAKLPPAPPVDPAKAEEAKQKAADAAKAGALLQAKYEDKAAANFAAKAKADGKTFKPQMGPGVPPPPVPAAAPAPAAPVVAAAAPAAAKPAVPAAAAPAASAKK